MDNDVVLVDENDTQIGTEDKMRAHMNGGKLHRAISVFVFNSKGELMLQKRASTKYHTPGMWSNTCCSHPFANEKPLEAAHRRLKTEMGFDCDMHEVFSFVYKAEAGNDLTEWEYDHVFFGFYDGTPRINRSEAEDWKFISLKDLKEDLKKNPDSYTPWVRISIDKVIKEHNKTKK